MSVTVLMISPGFPGDMPFFTRGLAEVGATVLGIGDQPRGGLAPAAGDALSDYLRVADLWDEDAVLAEVRDWLRGKSLDRIECMWEPGMLLAARLREALGIPGMGVEQATAFRDKEVMKQVLDRAGVRTPRHARGSTQDECRAAAEEIGYPLIIKPIDGAGSADTYPLREPGDLEDALARLGHVREVSVEEFIEGEEYTYDTVTANGEVLFQNVAWYRPTPLVSRLNPWMSPQAICLRDLESPEIAVGVELGRQVLEGLDYQTGFGHMEWYRTPAGEAVFGEIGARSPGGRLTHAMNFSCDTDLFAGWAEAVCHGTFSQPVEKRYNSAVIFKRAQGAGSRIVRIEGLESLMANWAEHLPIIDLNRIGAPRRDWRQVIEGDGWVIARHPDLATALALSDKVSSELVIVAG